MGEVYRARDERLQRDVALEVLPEPLAADPERTARFGREARTFMAPEQARGLPADHRAATSGPSGCGLYEMGALLFGKWRLSAAGSGENEERSPRIGVMRGSLYSDRTE